MSITTVDLLAFATNPLYLNTLSATNITSPAISFVAYDSSFSTVIGANATARLLAEPGWEAFHEAGIYSRADNSLYITSNYVDLNDNINITVLSLDDYSITSTQFPDVWEANGGTSYYPPGSNMSDTPPMQLYCDEGDFDHYSALVAVDPVANTSSVLVNNFLGRNFSSINDARQHPETGDVWFTDADYGYFQDFRPAPTIPKQVYRFEPDTGVIQVVADGFVQPNGLEFSSDLKTLYVTDTGAQEFGLNETRPATIYAFNVTSDSKRLENRRTFAFVDKGFADGIHADTAGNIWASCGDGVHIWNEYGILLGKIFLGETSNNFAFAPGRVFVFSNERLWIVENTTAVGREVCKDFGQLCE